MIISISIALLLSLSPISIAGNVEIANSHHIGVPNTQLAVTELSAGLTPSTKVTNRPINQINSVQITILFGKKVLFI